ncbi:MAG: hypothetical protein MZV70_60735 [Desulfobacterales bacterium]|nr:hypothetical protein [Desulfobacterales bacterium]
MMERNVFDRVARDYERIHNRSLPPGVRSADFIGQRAANRRPVALRRDTPATSCAIWISDAATAGCSNPCSSQTREWRWWSKAG